MTGPTGGLTDGLPARTPGPGAEAAAFRNANLHGVWVAIPIPWNADDTLDEGALRELVIRYRDAGLHGVYSTGTDGEFHTLELDDYTRVTEAFVRAASDAGIAAQVGVSWINVRGILERTAIAASLGVRCVQTTLPFWMGLNGLEAQAFFLDLAERFPSLGVVSYNTARTGHLLSADEFRALADQGATIIGAKHEGSDAQMLASTEQAPGVRQFAVDGGIVPGVLFGATGMYSFIANVAPRWTLEFWQSAIDGNWAEAVRRRRRLDHFLAAYEAALGPDVTAWASHAKAAVRCVLQPDMPLRVRGPYRPAPEDAVIELRRLIRTEYPEFAT